MSHSIFGNSDDLGEEDPWSISQSRLMQGSSILNDTSEQTRQNSWSDFNASPVGDDDPLESSKNYSFGNKLLLSPNTKTNSLSTMKQSILGTSPIEDPLTGLRPNSTVSSNDITIAESSSSNTYGKNQAKAFPATAAAAAASGPNSEPEISAWTEELTHSFNPLSYHNSDDKIIVTVKEIPEKEGLVFKHINYLISHNIKFSSEYIQQEGQKGNTIKVIRRYSDFAWLIEILWKKYPYRLIPELPPKKFSSTSSTSDTLFLQKRRRGLQRFLYEIMKHPILSKESLVIMFLTVPNEFANWKKYANIDSNDEFDGIRLPIPRRFKLNIEQVVKQLVDPSINDSADEQTGYQDDDDEENDYGKPLRTDSIVNHITQIWSENPLNHKQLDFVENLSSVDTSLTKFADTWNKLCILVERIERRNSALAMDKHRFSVFLGSFTEINGNVYGLDNLVTPLKGSSNLEEVDEAQNLSIINTMLKSVVKFFQTSKQLKDDEAQQIDSETLENFKKFHDYLVALHYSIERLNYFRTTSEKEVHALLNRLTRSNEKLSQVRIKSDIKGSEIDKLVTILETSNEELTSLLTKIILSKQCFVNEYRFKML
ncbi:unnamed protein product [[Candida] boidinii]|nr:unnamed protein product [[Candida] boidinii]